MNVLTLDNIAQLKEILSKSAQGTWLWGKYTKCDGREIETVQDAIDTCAASFRYSNKAELHGVFEEGTDKVICYTGNGPTSQDNAKAIHCVWMVLPELLKLAEEKLRNDQSINSRN